jgi:hypothetical protein
MDAKKKWRKILLGAARVFVLFLLPLSISVVDRYLNLSTLEFLLLCAILVAIIEPPIILIFKHYKKGLRLSKKGEYLDAVSEFEKSYAFFARHRLLDEFSTLMRSSSLESLESYAERSLRSISECYTSLGDKELSEKYSGMAMKDFLDGESL